LVQIALRHPIRDAADEQARHVRLMSVGSK
jgi:hypothetical protein